ncbi:hypothetical protein [Vagococcus silagei]|uniref:Uncharacterized protein n=1 Tax=Vagococcus silagei TaxID=2508885 RepID=A0A4S3B3E9_9ENTE|nr:hypothetical protein ESZ54_11225 [Vagococcus silagei]
MIGSQSGDIVVYTLSVILIVTSIIAIVKFKSKKDIIFLIVGLSPYLYMLVIFLLLTLKIIPFAP